MKRALRLANDRCRIEVTHIIARLSRMLETVELYEVTDMHVCIYVTIIDQILLYENYLQSSHPSSVLCTTYSVQTVLDPMPLTGIFA